MRVAYFDCFSGVSGDMILGALIDAGLDLGVLESELDKLKVSGYRIRAERAIRKGISGTKFSVDVIEQKAERRLEDILEIIDQSDLDTDVKELSKEVFEQLAIIEAKIHCKNIEDVHFHEVGALDSVIDVVGSLIGIKRLGIEAVYSSKVHVGTGFVRCQHGILPVPAPATLELLKGIPIYSTGIKAELVTPTGAAILKTLSKSFGVMPEMEVKRIGYGAGSRDLEIPNLLRVYIGEVKKEEYQQDKAILVQTNIDDMNPEFFDYVTEKLLKKGALDVFMTPVFMKKNRPGTMLSVLTEVDRLDEILSTIFTETTTLGVRILPLERRKLSREIFSVTTPFGEVKVKIGKIGNRIKNIAPEYDDCKKIAAKQGVPLKDIYDQAKQAAQKAILKKNESA